MTLIPKRICLGVRRPAQGSLQLRYTVGGKEVVESVAKALGKPPRDVTVQDAKDLLIRRRAEVLEGRYVAPASGTIRDVLLNYAEAMVAKKVKTFWLARPEAAGLARYGGNRVFRLNAVDDTLGAMKAAEVTTPVIRRWAMTLRSTGYAPGTVHNIAWVLHAALRQAKTDGLIRDLPDMPQLETSEPRRGFFEPEAVQQIVRALAPPADGIARFAYLTGRRASECRLLRWEWVNRRTRVLTIPTTKNGEAAQIPLEGELWDLIAGTPREYRVGDTTALSAWIFHVKGEPLTERRFRTLWDQARTVTGLRAAIPHDFRRTFAKDAVDAGMDEGAVMDMGGWKSRQVFDRYNIRSVKRLRDGQRALQAFRAQAAPVVRIGAGT